jgi:hypothetical protein
MQKWPINTGTTDYLEAAMKDMKAKPQIIWRSIRQVEALQPWCRLQEQR